MHCFDLCLVEESGVYKTPTLPVSEVTTTSHDGAVKAEEDLSNNTMMRQRYEGTSNLQGYSVVHLVVA